MTATSLLNTVDTPGWLISYQIFLENQGNLIGKVHDKDKEVDEIKTALGDLLTYMKDESVKFDKRGEDPETIKTEMIDFIITKIKTIEEIKACKSKVNKCTSQTELSSLFEKDKSYKDFPFSLLFERKQNEITKVLAEFEKAENSTKTQDQDCSPIEEIASGKSNNNPEFPAQGGARKKELKTQGRKENHSRKNSQKIISKEEHLKKLLIFFIENIRLLIDVTKNKYDKNAFLVKCKNNILSDVLSLEKTTVQVKEEKYEIRFVINNNTSNILKYLNLENSKPNEKSGKAYKAFKTKVTRFKKGKGLPWEKLDEYYKSLSTSEGFSPIIKHIKRYSGNQPPCRGDIETLGFYLH